MKLYLVTECCCWFFFIVIIFFFSVSTCSFYYFIWLQSKWNHFQICCSLLCFALRCAVLYCTELNRARFCQLFSGHLNCLRSLSLITFIHFFFFSRSINTFCVSDVWWIIKCVYGFPFDTRPCLRTEFLIVSHYCANLNSLPLLSSLVCLLSSLDLICLCTRAASSYCIHTVPEEIIKYFFFRQLF